MVGFWLSPWKRQRNNRYSKNKNHCVKISKYGPEKTPYLDTFHAVNYKGPYLFLLLKQGFIPIRLLSIKNITVTLKWYMRELGRFDKEWKRALLLPCPRAIRKRLVVGRMRLFRMEASMQCYLMNFISWNSQVHLKVWKTELINCEDFSKLLFANVCDFLQAGHMIWAFNILHVFFSWHRNSAWYKVSSKNCHILSNC